MKYIGNLLEVRILILPHKDKRNTLKSIDKWEEEVVNKIVMMHMTEIIDMSHEVDEDLTKLILAMSVDASSLEEIKEKFHCVITVFDEDTCITF